MKDLILGIDPGLTGAFAFYDPAIKKIRSLGRMALMPKGKKKQIDAHELARQWDNEIQLTKYAVIELVSAREGQGVVSMFTFGQTLGIVQGMIAAFQIPIVFVSPQMWKGCLKLSSNKGESRSLATALFPGLGFEKKSDDGRAEACLLAVYGALYHGNSIPLPKSRGAVASAEEKRAPRSGDGVRKDSDKCPVCRESECWYAHCRLSRDRS